VLCHSFGASVNHFLTEIIQLRHLQDSCVICIGEVHLILLNVLSISVIILCFFSVSNH
jgi:hypothetical protein